MMTSSAVLGLFVTSVLAIAAGRGRPCRKPADLFFVVDGSASLTDDEFLRCKQFVINVLQTFDVRRGGVHFGANVFGADVYDRIQLHGTTMYTLLMRRIQSMERVSLPGTATYKALAEMRDEIQANGRAGTPAVCVVITDGKSNNEGETSREAYLTRNAGINILAVGVGQNRYKAELFNIAGTTDNIYETANLTEVVRTIQDAIKDFICPVTITTVVPSVPETVTTPRPDNLGGSTDCPDCMVGTHRGFEKHPLWCEKYIEHFQGESGDRMSLVRMCRVGLFWEQTVLSCRLPQEVLCYNDPCKNTSLSSYGVDDRCNVYIACMGGRSVRACCKADKRYVPGSGCVSDVTCQDSCYEDEMTVHGNECRSVPHPTDRNQYIENVPAFGNITRACSPTTMFNQVSCTCSDVDPTAIIPTTCDPAADFPFASDFTDKSKDRMYAGTENVKINTGSAKFTGSGMVNLYRFAADTFGELLVMKFNISPSRNGSGTEAVLTNSAYSTLQTASVTIKLVRGRNVVVFATDTRLGTQEVSLGYTPGQSNEVVYIYDGVNLTGVVNGVKVQKPLTGDILLRNSGIILGAGDQLSSYTGTIKQFQLWKCMPDFADILRKP